ncbi:hypothetical protein Aperf_G00000066950 [Anoplocephala perfoliata]
MVTVDSDPINKVSPHESDSLKNEAQESETLDILGNGLVEKKILKRGLGQDSRPNHGDSVIISYKGWLEDGTPVEEAQNLRVVIGDGECIHAFDLALPLAELKEVFELTTDPRFAYGTLGKPPEIPPNAKLTYHITLDECGEPPCYEDMTIGERFEISNRKRERGNFYFRREEYQYSLSCYSKALEILLKKSRLPKPQPSEKPSDSSAPPPSPDQLIDLEIKLKNNIGASQLKVKAYEAAIKSCDAVLQLEPSNVKAHFRKGQAYEALNEYTEAITAYEEGLRHHPSSGLLQLSLQRTKQLWKNERSRQVKVLSKYFKKHNISQKQSSGIKGCLKGIWSNYKYAISAAVLAGASVIIGGAFLHFNEQQ